MFARFTTRALLGVLALSLIGSSLLDTRTSGAEQKQPNLIVIMADDLGAKELSCYGHEKHETPHLDRLAKTGVQFNTAYTACICHPTRFEIMTGQYASNNGVYHFAGRAGGPNPDSPEEQIVNHLTFGKVLKQAGYATAQAGKWQLTGKVPTLVYENGFDEYCMWAYAHNLPEGVKHTGGFEGGTKTSRYWHPSILKNGKKLPTTMDDFGPDIYTDFVIDFARRHKEGPFFIYYPMALTHSPYYSMPPSNPDAKEKFRHSKDKFQENVEYMDTLVGRIVEALDQMGIREDTIVMFTGDNGTGGEGKGQPTELGARVPMIVNCPGRVKPIGLSGALVDTSDVMPTLVELAGANLPEGHPIDGKSLAPILRGEKADVREWIFSYLADRRVLRTKRFLLEKNSPSDYGQLYDCGSSRDGTGYKDVTNSTDPEVLAVKKKFDEILATQPVPEMKERAKKPKKKGKKTAK
jgi:arylsulfatase A